MFSMFHGDEVGLALARLEQEKRDILIGDDLFEE